MNILIVDDDQRKVRKLIELFVELHVDRDSIEVAPNATRAREYVRDHRFDVIILDLLLPLREETEPRVEVSIEFLKEVTERDVYHRPRQFVGFTAHKELIEGALPHFEEYLWTIVQFDDTTDEWEAIFKNLTSYLQAIESEPSVQTFGTDLCVVTALPAVEFRALHELPWNWKASEPMDENTFVRSGQFQSKGELCSVISACAPRMGCVASSLLSAKMILRYRPRFLVMTGICAGVKSKANIGDIVLFSPVWEWASGKLVPEGEQGTYLEPAPHQLAVPDFVMARMEELRKDVTTWASIQGAWAAPPSNALRLLLGPSASGSAVIADSNVLEGILAQHRRLTAVDMEAYGIMAAAASVSSPKPTSFVLKSVCDFADDKKVDTWQPYAAYTSVNALRAFFERYMSDIRDLAGS